MSVLRLMTAIALALSLSASAYEDDVFIAAITCKARVEDRDEVAYVFLDPRQIFSEKPLTGDDAIVRGYLQMPTSRGEIVLIKFKSEDGIREDGSDCLNLQFANYEAKVEAASIAKAPGEGLSTLMLKRENKAITYNCRHNFWH